LRSAAVRRPTAKVGKLAKLFRSTINTSTDVETELSRPPDI